MALALRHLSTRIQIAVAVLAIVAMLGFLRYVDSQERQVVLAEQAAELDKVISLDARRLLQVVDTLRRDTLFLSRTPPVSGISRAARNDGVDPRDGNLQATWNRRLQEIFKAFAEAHPQYVQIRYIGVAGGGRELVRIDHRGNRVTVSNDGDLQVKGNHDYFRQTSRLKIGEVFLSSFDLNREHGLIEVPHRPMLRAATPVFDGDGQLFGMIVVNMDVGTLFAGLSGSQAKDMLYFIADQDGHYLHAPEPELAFSYELGNTRLFPEDLPELAGLFVPTASPRRPTQATSYRGQRLYLAAERVQHDPRRPETFLILAYGLPEEALDRRADAAVLRAAGIAAVIGLLLGGLLVLLVRHLMSPLQRMTRAAQAIAEGAREVDLPGGSGEVGALSRAFRHMLDRVDEREKDYQRLNGELENRVRERTAALRLAASVVDNTSEGVAVVSEAGIILSVNPAFSEITGYRAEEAIGQSPRLLRSDHHDRAFYQQMWTALIEQGSWQGEIWNRRKNGEVYPEWLTINRIPAADGAPACYVSVFNDITEQRRQDERIRHLAFHDALTGLPNRFLLIDRVRHAIDRARRAGERLGMLFIDLDRFKGINDTLGHDIGDQLLQHVAGCLRSCLRSSDTVARMGGDEFVVLLENVMEPERAANLAANIIKAVAQPVELADQLIHPGASIGISLFPDDSDDALTLMKYADTAMYAAKAGGRGGFRFFRSEMTELTARRLTLESQLRRALDSGQMELHYQPKVNLLDGRVDGVEALVRWRHPEQGLVPPGDFIPVAEESGLIVRLGDWVLTEACRQAALWQARGLDLVIAINVSAKQLQDGCLPDRLLALSENYGIRPASLQVELTESLVMADPEKNARLFSQLRQMGVTIAVDDFGTGYSSLSYLRRLPIDVLKIDRSFVMPATQNKEDEQVVKTIIALANALHLSVVAEGVEEPAHIDLLVGAGCPVAQGFYFARALPVSELEAWLATRRLS